MIVSSKKKFIFIHIPKTAGTSLKIVLKKYGASKGILNFLVRRFHKNGLAKFLYCLRTYDAHTSIKDLYKLIPTRCIQSYFKFCVVRNPYERLVSFYFHILKEKHHPWHQKIASYGSFEVLVNNLEVVNEPSQLSYIRNEQGKLEIDQIIYYESLTLQLPLLSKQLGFSIHIPHENKSKHNNWKEYYTPALRDKVYTFYQEDFVAFNYPYGLD